ncbi:unnamed protein product [Linum tenue]|uniref:glutathione transferase n=2 Tax=Linum tenue TaxID=586396 RepID=A0AAV0RGP8_9ROSI|nr:unnamed protein product [Linum tenue]CAI0556307.1 unnamed protein product [Linum tenue]
MGEVEEVKLLMTGLSPFAGRIIWALKLKGVEFESVEEDLTNKSDLLLQSNPVHQKIPVLIHNGKPVSESLVIMEYIDEVWNQTCPLLPADPHQRALTRFWAKFVDEKAFASMWSALQMRGKEGGEAALEEAHENLRILEKELEGKKFFGGESIGLVDVTFGSFAKLLDVLDEVMGSDKKMIDEDKFPLMGKWKEQLSELAVVKSCLPPADKLAAAVQARRNESAAA